MHARRGIPAVVTELLVKVVASYLLGSLIGSLIVGRLRGGVDIRTLGSGNAGSTNALRTQGAAFALWVIIIDVAKGWIAAGILPALALPGVPAAAPSQAAWLPAACGFAAIIGHVFPVWHGFRGGKGVATSAGGCLAVFPAYFPIDLLVAAIGAVAARRAERATQLSGAAWITASVVWWRADLANGWGPEPSFGLVAFATISSAMILTKFAFARRTALT